MRYDKVLRRDDGSRMKITVWPVFGWGNDPVTWDFEVYHARTKRTFERCPSDRATAAQIQQAMLECWEAMKPTGGNIQ